MNAQMRTALITAHAIIAQQCVARKEVIVVAGVRGDNLPPIIKHHESVIVLDGDEVARHTLPVNTGLLLSTRFLQHAAWSKMLDEAKKQGVKVFPQPLTTGELRLILQPLVKDIEEAMTGAGTVAVPVERKVTARPGEVKAFVERYGDPNYVSLIDEATRLLPIAQQALNIPTTMDSLCSSIRQYLRPARPRLVPPPEPTPPPPPAPAPVAETAPPDDEQEVLILLRDAIAAMLLVQERFTLLLEKNRRSGDLKRKLQELADGL